MKTMQNIPSPGRVFSSVKTIEVPLFFAEQLGSALIVQIYLLFLNCHIVFSDPVL